MKPYNYASKFLDETSVIFSPTRDKLVATNLETGAEMNNQSYQAIRDGVKCSTKYILPDDGKIEGFTLKNKKQYTDMVRMPYTAVTLEANIGKNPTILLCQAHSDLGMGKFSKAGKYLKNTLRDKQGNHVPMIEALEIHDQMIGVGFSVLPIQRIGDSANLSLKEIGVENRWVIFQFIGVMSYQDIVTWKDCGDNLLPFTLESLDESSSPVDEIRDANDEVNKRVHEFFGEIMEIVTQFCICQNMRGIRAKTIAVPDKINKKRIKRGKKPLYEYKILDIHESAIRNKGAIGTSGHKNRWHTVCGHPRFYKDKDKPVWIKPHSRGDKEMGVIDKSYRLSKKGV